MTGARTVTGRYVAHEPTLDRLSEDEGLKAMVARMFGRDTHIGESLAGVVVGPSPVELTAYDTALLARTAHGDAILDLGMLRHRLESELPPLDGLLGKMNLEEVAKRYMVLDSVLPAQRQPKRSNTTLLAMAKASHQLLDFYGVKRHGS